MLCTALAMSADSVAACNLYMGYSDGRAGGPVPSGLAAHVAYTRMAFDGSTPEMQSCLNELFSGRGAPSLDVRYVKAGASRSTSPVPTCTRCLTWLSLMRVRKFRFLMRLRHSRGWVMITDSSSPETICKCRSSRR